MTLKLPFVGKTSLIFLKKIKLTTESIYSATTPRINFVSKPKMLKLSKNLIEGPNTPRGQKLRYLHIQLLLWNELYCANFSPCKNNGQRTRSQVCEKYFIEAKTTIISAALMHSIRRLSVSEHLVYNPECGNNYEDVRFKLFSYVQMFMIE